MPSHSAKPTQRAKRQPHNKPNPWAKNLAIDAKSAPLLRRSRNTGGPRTSESEGRGGCGGRVPALCTTFKKSKTPTLQSRDRSIPRTGVIDDPFDLAAIDQPVEVRIGRGDVHVPAGERLVGLAIRRERDREREQITGRVEGF